MLEAATECPDFRLGRPLDASGIWGRKKVSSWWAIACRVGPRSWVDASGY